MREEFGNFFFNLLSDIADTDPQVVLLAILLVATVIVLDSISSHAKVKRKQTGIQKKEETSPDLRGLQSLPVKSYVSDMQGLAGKPDALISEQGHIIPIERKPLSKKIHDRFVAQLLVYMRLVEEFEGKKPPYGYLILGSNCRKVKIYNTEKRQTWLQKHIDEMKAILTEGLPAVPSPHPMKCKKCYVRDACQFKMDLPEKKQEGSPGKKKG